MSEDPLDKFIVDEEETIDRELLSSLIGEDFRISKNGEIILNKSFYKLVGYAKVLKYLIARKVILIKNLKKDAIEEAKSKEISDGTGLPDSSVRKFLSVDLKGIVKSGENGYHIPNYNLYKCEELLK